MLTAMRSWPRLVACGLATCVGASAASAASSEARADEPSAANVAAARRHFERARDYYSHGSYREAIDELESAHALDPTAKDLVFNLGLVEERLSEIDAALKWFRLYTTLSLTAPERERADAYIRRLEGAKRELEDKQQAPLPPPGAQPPPIRTVLPTAPDVEHAPMGRIDAFTIGAATTAVTGLAFGVVLAALAQRDKPPSQYVTGRNGSYSDMLDEQSKAHREAVIADIGFSVAGAAAVATAVLFFGRSRATGATSQRFGSTAAPRLGPGESAHERPAAGTTSVSAAPIACGGLLSVQGTF
jgi:hypothetical protein